MDSINSMKNFSVASLISLTVLPGCIKYSFTDDPRCWQCTEVRTVYNHVSHEAYSPDSSASQVCDMTYRVNLVYESSQAHYVDYGQDSKVVFTTSCK